MHKSLLESYLVGQIIYWNLFADNVNLIPLEKLEHKTFLDKMNIMNGIEN